MARKKKALTHLKTMTAKAGKRRPAVQKTAPPVVRCGVCRGPQDDAGHYQHDDQVHQIVMAKLDANAGQLFDEYRTAKLKAAAAWKKELRGF